MECEICKVSVMDKPLLRFNEKGVDGVYRCKDCFKETEPELYKNQVEDLGEIWKDLTENT